MIWWEIIQWCFSISRCAVCDLIEFYHRYLVRSRKSFISIVHGLFFYRFTMKMWFKSFKFVNETRTKHCPHFIHNFKVNFGSKYRDKFDLSLNVGTNQDLKMTLNKHTTMCKWAINTTRIPYVIKKYVQNSIWIYSIFFSSFSFILFFSIAFRYGEQEIIFIAFVSSLVRYTYVLQSHFIFMTVFSTENSS